MMRVLVTGASGFIGRHCLPALRASGYEVHAICREVPQQIGDQDIHWRQVDLFDSQQTRALLAETQPTHLLHLAWCAVPGSFWTSPANIRWVQASLNLFQSFAAAGGQRVVVAGTCAEYSWEQAGVCHETATPLVPGTLYGACKHALQVMLRAWAANSGLTYAWGRIFFPYGPHDHAEKMVSYVVRSMLMGEPVTTTHGHQVRDFLYVEDVAAAFVALLNAEICGAVNIGSGEAVTLREVIERTGEITGRGDLIRFGSLAPREGEPDVMVADVGRLRDVIGWQPSYDLSRGLERTVEWWRKEVSLKP